MQTLTIANRQLAEPLKLKEAERAELQHQLEGQGKDQLALKNLTARSAYLDTALKESNTTWRSLEERCAKAEKERNDLYSRFASAVKEMKKKSEYKNVLLDRKLELVEQEFAKQQGELGEILAGSKLEPGVVERLTGQLEDTLGQKNRLIQNLEYAVQQSSKRYNDAVRVYEAKLRKLGVPSEELGFEQIPYPPNLGKMPAGML